MQSLKEKVANGVRWLDENHAGWKSKINISILNMEFTHKCILGQLFNGYREVEKILGRAFCEDHGFVISYEQRELTEEWLKVLEETFNLSKDKVKPGFYKVVNPKIVSFSIDEILLVISPHSNMDIRSDCGNTINCVVDSNYKMFVNCPVIVKKSETGF
jgi:hypothetical protein